MQEKFAYLENKSLRVQVAHLPYTSSDHDSEFVFTIILPEKGVPLDQIEGQLNKQPGLLKNLLSRDGTSNQELSLYLPKFKIESTFNLNAVLARMGIQDAFDERNANFTGIVSPQDEPEGLFISKVNKKD